MNKEKVAAKTKKSKTKRSKKTVLHGRAHVFASFNNTIVMIADLKGNALAISSAGACGFRGSKKGTAYAAQIAANQVLNQAINQFGLKQIDIFVKGIGQGRESAIRSLINKGLQVDKITDQTTIPHGGVRPRKARRS